MLRWFLIWVGSGFSAVSAIGVSISVGASVSIGAGVGVGAIFAISGLLRLILIEIFIPSSNKSGLERIVQAPGAKAVLVLIFLVPKKTFEEVFAQAIVDMRDEYFAALAAGKLWQARWIGARDNANLFLVFVQYLVAAFLDRGIKIYQAISSK